MLVLSSVLIRKELSLGNPVAIASGKLVCAFKVLEFTAGVNTIVTTALLLAKVDKKLLLKKLNLIFKHPKKTT